MKIKVKHEGNIGRFFSGFFPKISGEKTEKKRREKTEKPVFSQPSKH